MSIFINQDQVAKNIKDSAEKLGAPKVKTKKARLMMARKNCKICYGQGKFKHILPNSKAEKVLYCQCVTQKVIDVEDTGDSIKEDKFADINAALDKLGNIA